MTAEPYEIEIHGCPIWVVRKRVKHLRLSVHPPEGRVRVAVPLRLDEATLRSVVAGKIDWIRRQQALVAGRARPSPRQMVSGEIHDFLGRGYRLDVRSGRRSRVALRGDAIELHVPAISSAGERESVLGRWYRKELRLLIPPLLDKWQPVLGVGAQAWGVKRMKTRWGSCNTAARRIWLSLELARKPPECLEYVVVHELVHLLERRHDGRFFALMDRHLPDWRRLRGRLNEPAPLASPGDR